MTKNIDDIRKELVDHIEIEMPYLFDKGIHIKYITQKEGTSVFYRGGKFHKLGNERIFLSNNGRIWSVPTRFKDRWGNITYKSRFFIHKESEDDIQLTANERELKQIINKQQEIIKKLTIKINQLQK